MRSSARTAPASRRSGRSSRASTSPTTASCWVNGHRVAYRSARDALADGVTLIAQEPTLVPHRSVLENVFLGVEDTVAGVVEQRKLAQRYERARRATRDRAAGREARAHPACRRPAEGRDPAGDRARRALRDHGRADLGAHARRGRPSLRAVRRLQASGTTIVYVSHFLAEVLALADTVTVLRDGRSWSRRQPAEGETPERLVTAMLGPDARPRVPREGAAAGRRAGGALRPRTLAIPPAVNGVSFEHPRRRDRRAGRADRQRPLRGRTRDLRRRHRAPAERSRSPASRCGCGRRARRSASGVVMLPEDRKGQGLLMLRSIVDNVTLPHLGEVSEPAYAVGVGERRARAS